MIIRQARGRLAELVYPGPLEASGPACAAGFALDAVLLLVLALVC